jgi:uncharacterized protein (TIGR02231 family)
MTTKQDSPVALGTAIVAVTVYPDRARVVRNGAATLEPGTTRLEIADLPLSLDRASVRAAARGTARARLLGVDVRSAFFAETPAEQVRVLETQIETRADEILTLDTQIELLQQERAILGELASQTRAYAHGLATGTMTFEGQLAILDGLRSRNKAINKAILDTEVRRREPQRQIEKLRRELKLVRAAQPSERYAAIVEVEVLQAGELTVELTYVVSGAGWVPLYDLRLLEGDGAARLEVGYLAQVTQRTGEAWADVTLALSTARPALAGHLPELKPWYIGPPPPPPLVGMGVPAAFRVAAPAEDDGIAIREAPPVAAQVVATEVVLADVETSGAAVTYRVPATVTIPDDGAPRKVTVARYDLTPHLGYVVTPKLVEAAYRRGRVANDSPYTLLPGQANLFAGDEFIGSTPLRLTAPQGEIELYLGVDDRIKVKRELKGYHVDRQLLGGRRRRHYTYEIVLENLLTSEVQLTVRDQLPVSRHEDVRVHLDAVEPKPTEQTDLNELVWELHLVPAQKQVVRFEFTVEHPQDMVLSGLA